MANVAKESEIEELYFEDEDPAKEKLNELIRAYNRHFHESLDTHYFTTSPKVLND